MNDIRGRGRDPAGCGFFGFVRSRSDAAGFTLVEILAVVAVISILAALSFSMMSQMRNEANEGVCLSNLRQYGTASLIAISDHNGYLSAPEVGWNPGPPPGPDYEDLAAFVNAYVTSQLICPNSVRNPPYNGTSYCVNKAIWDATGGNGNTWPNTLPTRPVNSISIPHSRVVLAAEASSGDILDGFYYLDWTMWGGSPSAGVSPRTATAPYAPNPAQYHGSYGHRGLNMFMLDGTAALIYPYQNGGWGPPTDNGMSAGETYGKPGNTGYYYSFEQFTIAP
jgi:prepilin-type N-terminal cleavage/methylation domain-containing protein